MEAAIGTVLSAAQTIFAALKCSELRQICSTLGYASELEKLEETVKTIRAVLLDGEAKQELSHQERDWVDKLKDALYDADDLLDEFATLAQQRQQLLEGDEEISKKMVRSFFSRLNNLGVAYKLSLGVQSIRKNLDAIASDCSKFGFKVDNEPIRRRREETCSYVYEKNVIGREDDTKAIVDMLLDPNNDVGRKDVSFLTIVGIGGLGKTTLAQLVYNDERVRNEFPLRAWACVSDDYKRPLDIKPVLCKVLESVTGERHEGLALDSVQRKLRQLLEGSKYLVILDDVWSENPVELRSLAEFLMGGRRGSRIVVTTRSRETARVIGDGHAYELQGLSKENSQRLFEMAAFGELQEQPFAELVDIGREIVGKCAGVPLAIRVVGSLLYGQGKSTWLSFQSNGIANIRRGSNDIVPILKFSYYHLDSSLKSCFSYCALFPKDFVMRKEMLIGIWMSHGCIVPYDEGQSIEDAAEECFSILLRRCFFQNIERDEFGEIVACQVHDLMHDVAQEIAGNEVQVGNYITCNLGKKVRHLSLTEGDCAESFITKTKLRTYIFSGRNSRHVIPVGTILANWTCLRVLDLHDSYIDCLPEAIGKLLHLRYIDLSGNHYLTVLPKSITELHNLQILRLHSCSYLRELPNDLRKLVNLRVLDTEGCHSLAHMPSGMDKLACLHSLTRFVVYPTSSSSEQCVAHLEDLKALTNLKGCLIIYIGKRDASGTFDKEKVREGGYLRRMEHLNKVVIEFEGGECDARTEYMEALLEGLKPHPNLQTLELSGYNGVATPSWAREGRGFLPVNLVSIKLWGCHRLHYLPISSLGKLRHLKRLSLTLLENIEWIENASSSTSSSLMGNLSLFPSFEEVDFFRLPKLKGWLGDHELVASTFPRLCKMRLIECPQLTWMPLCPSMEELYLSKSNRALLPIITTEAGEKGSGCGDPKLRSVRTDNVGYLSSLPAEAFQGLIELHIDGDQELECLSEVGEVLRSCSSSLRSFKIWSCYKLRSLCGGLEHLTTLESLVIDHVGNLDLIGDQDDDDGMPWRSLQHSLRSLELRGFYELVHLPKGMQHLTSLQSLKIERCPNLQSLPEWIHCISSLQSLDID